MERQQGERLKCGSGMVCWCMQQVLWELRRVCGCIPEVLPGQKGHRGGWHRLGRVPDIWNCVKGIVTAIGSMDQERCVEVPKKYHMDWRRHSGKVWAREVMWRYMTRCVIQVRECVELWGKLGRLHGVPKRCVSHTHRGWCGRYASGAVWVREDVWRSGNICKKIA